MQIKSGSYQVGFQPRLENGKPGKMGEHFFQSGKSQGILSVRKSGNPS